MNLKFIPRHCFKNLSRFNGTKLSTFASLQSNGSAIIVFSSSSIPCFHTSPISRNPNYIPPVWDSRRIFTTKAEGVASDEEAYIKDFLSRFVWIMRGKLKEAYPDSEKKMIDGMLLVIVQKVVSEIEKDGIGMTQKLVVDGDYTSSPGEDFSVDLWKTVWEVSNWILNEMQIVVKKEKMKKFLHCDTVKRMVAFAFEIGVRGDFLRELWYKWAREEMEIQEGFSRLDKAKEAFFAMKSKKAAKEKISDAFDFEEEDKGALYRVNEALANRSGKINYKIYGLDLSGLQWRVVADRIHEAEFSIWPLQPKAITGKCKAVTEKILSLEKEDELPPLLAEWSELLHPTRADWLSLLGRLEKASPGLHFKATELVLSEEAFQSDIGDYSKLIYAYAKSNSVNDAERIMKKMTDKGISPDFAIYSAFIHMYSAVGNIHGMKHYYEILRGQGFKPNTRVYQSLISAYVSGNQPILGESLLREMEMIGITPTKNIYLSLLRAFSKKGDGNGAHRISSMMQFAGIPPCPETYALLIEAYARAGDADEARANFDFMRSSGHRPDDSCVAVMVSAYKGKNALDKGLNLLIDLGKESIEPGVKTLTVLLDWFCRLMLIDEAEHILEKIGREGGFPPLEVHVSLCEMYSMAKMETEMRRSLSVLEMRKEEMGNEEMERVVIGLFAGGYADDAKRILREMDARGVARSPRILFAIGNNPFRRN